VLRRGLLHHRGEGLAVGGAVVQVGRDDHLMISIDDGLGVEALRERPIRGLHDPRVRVGEVALRLRFRDRPVCSCGGPFRDDLLVLTCSTGPLSGLGGGPLGGFGFQRRLRLRDLHEPALTAGQLLR